MSRDDLRFAAINRLGNRARNFEKREKAYVAPTYEDDRSRINNLGDRSNLPPQGAWAPTPPGDMPGERYPTATVHLKPGNKSLRVRVADTPALRKVGLQNTPASDGGEQFTPMLFHWPDGQEVQATLHNAGVDYPVSAYFFDSSGCFRDLQNMLPHDGAPIRARAPHRYALEIHPDDADALGLSESSQIAIEHDAKDTTKSGTINLGS